jgi:hypothetical protein
MNETFWDLLRDPAHWQFELLVGFIEMLVFDVIIGALAWPVIKRHIHRDVKGQGDVSRTYAGELLPAMERPPLIIEDPDARV